MPKSGARPEYHVWGGLEPRAWRVRGCEPITGVWGQSPQWGTGAEPLVREALPLKLKLKTF